MKEHEIMIETAFNPSSSEEIRSSSRRRRVGLGVTAALILSLALPMAAQGPAGADGDARPVVAHSADPADGDVSSAVEAAVGRIDPAATVVGTSDSDSASIATVDGISVDVPSDSMAAVTVSGAGNPRVSITPPPGYGASRQTSNGTVVASGKDGALAIQPQDGGVRFLTVLSTASSPRAYRYRVVIEGGGRLQATPSGAVAVVAGEDQGAFGTIDAPWAVDASGARVPTHYEVDGADLVQTVEPTETTVYPVVADPDYKTNCGSASCSRYYTNLFSIEMYDKYQSKISAGYSLQTAICAIGALGGPVGVVYSVMCGIAWQWLNYQFVDAITDAKNRGGCAVDRYLRFDPLGANDPYDWDYVSIDNQYCIKS